MGWDQKADYYLEKQEELKDFLKISGIKGQYYHSKNLLIFGGSILMAWIALLKEKR